MINIRGMVIALMVLLLAAPVVYAQPKDSSDDTLGSQAAAWRQKRKEKMQEIFSQLNLTEEQKKQLKENKMKNREQRKAGFEKMKSYKEALKQELVKPELNKKRIKQIQGQLKDAQAQMADDRLDSILEVRTILTPEQFAKFMTLMEEHQAKRWNRFQKDHKGEAVPEEEPSEK